MNRITHKQAILIILKAAQENRVYHFNGGQTYIKIQNDNDAMMVIDTTLQTVSIELFDGNHYLEQYAGYNSEYSPATYKAFMETSDIVAELVGCENK